MAEQAARLGVVAIGRNEGARLERCLRSLADAPGPVIYVDSGSSDGSPERAAALGAEVLGLDPRRPFTAARARAEGFQRLGLLAPELEFVMFVDGDCEVEPGWLGAATGFLDREPGFAVVCGRRRERFPQASRYNALADSEWATPIGEALASGGDAVFRCAAYRAVGGFDPAIIAGEEPELCSRLRAAGWRIMRLDMPMTVHDAAMDRFSQWWRRAVRSGMGYAQAWWATRARGPGALFRAELLRALAWAGVLPLFALLLGAAVHPALVLLWPLATLAQALRIARREGWFRAKLSVAGKYAELIGAVRYALRALVRPTGALALDK
ncbi:MAG: hypothetical protein B7Z08_00185 [Sphingomonadales bacterium 32-68-7]|nr:MAG: hypothetical protein B7Z33_09380 [Sphingomonadales bacterium 12-68-11]OYX10554.1 MAG: hypothetical protein B7Z08_00185 [Sphingomonadales bacterium 32-68-7]